jgi:hypothetical protein
MAILPKALYMFHAIPIKIPMTCITEIEKPTLKVIWKHKRLQISNAILSNTGAITIPDFKLYYRAIETKTVWYWHKNRYEDQWNRIEDPDMNPHSYAYLIFEKGVKSIRWRKDSLFNKCCWENWISTCRRLKLNPCLLHCASMSTKVDKELNIRPETLKLVQERSANTLEPMA